MNVLHGHCRQCAPPKYEWNERNQRNQLRRSVTSWIVQYRYGADGQRAIKYATQGGSYNETLYFNKMLQVGKIQEFGTGDIESKHIYVGETRIVTKQRSVGNNNYGQEKENQYYYHGDHLGSAQVITDHEGKLYEHIEYTPYGELWVECVTEQGNIMPFRFTGKEYDRETGLYYYGARYLDPRTSRWLSTDPAMGEYIPGAPINDEVKKHNQNLPGMGGVFNAINLHTYAYSFNNPIRYKDPDGRYPPYFTFTGKVAQQIAKWDLAFAQIIAMNDPEYFMGGSGHIGNTTGTATWCNQSTFDIAEFMGFNTEALYGDSTRGWTTANMATANLAKAASEGIIEEVTGERAKELAEKGFVVIAARADLRKGRSGHISTVYPLTNLEEYNEANGPTIVHIGLSVKIATTKYGFITIEGVKYYYDPKQSYVNPHGYIVDLSLGE